MIYFHYVRCQSELPILQVKWMSPLLKMPWKSATHPAKPAANHLRGLSQMVIWKVFSHYLLCDVTAHFSTWLIHHLMPKNGIILGFSCYLSGDSDMTLRLVYFLLKKNIGDIFENWLNLTAWDWIHRIYNFLTLSSWTSVCLHLGNGNENLYTQHLLRLYLRFFKIKYRKFRSIWM